MLTADTLPGIIRDRVIAAHNQEDDHAFDCLTPMFARTAELLNEGEPVDWAIRRAAVKHSRAVRWTRDNVGLD